jgi:hypothetical protein
LKHFFWPIAAVLFLGLVSQVQTAQVKKPLVSAGSDGALVYALDARGNCIPDFSAAGYGGGGVAWPDAPVRVTVTATGKDDGARIQAALDYVAGLSPDAQGVRGAVRLTRGRYEIADRLRINASGVVLRGAGEGEDGSVLVAVGTNRRTLIEVSGRADMTRTGSIHRVVDAYASVGAKTLTLDDAAGLRVGDHVLVERPSEKSWIDAIGMADSPARQPFAWRPGKMNLAWDRRIVALDAMRMTLDAPITTALDHEQGGGTVATYTWPGRIAQAGVENLRCESAFDTANPRDEQHAWDAISLDNTEDAWVTNVAAVHFAGSAVRLGAGARRVTVQDCVSLAPVSELGGYRRHTFHTSGQLTLFQRCRAENGLHDFTVGYLTCGPNVFLDCQAVTAQGFSGSIGSWASGALFDNVTIDGNALKLDNLETWNQGVGWAAANSVLWQCSASVIACRQPPGAANWAVGVWAEFVGDGLWDRANEFVHPDSLYRAQLAQRNGEKALVSLQARSYPQQPTEAPALETAVPDLARRLAPTIPPPGKPLALENGWLTSGGALLTGTQAEIEWWRGHLLPARATEFGPSLTRFVPGQTGSGLTDDLDELTDAMMRAGQVVLRHHWGLWYDRRREDHERGRRASADVWPPFFEQPWARSGQGEAWDRLSRYDLTRFNPWYFARLREFAEQSRRKGLVLVNEMYFQHNVLEAGAHWADFPWRPANCLQSTGFPEPPPYVGDKRIFMAESFYDVSHPVRRELHRAYIRQCLANLADQPNVIHTLGAEYSGPLSFMQFWLDVAAEWEIETGRHPLIALSAPKDVQDAILADAARSRMISVIDLKYWWRTDDGKKFAPAGGTTLAPRQHEREWKGDKPSAASIAGMAREYRLRFPDKAVISDLDAAEGWSFAAAGGSLLKLPSTTDPALRAALARMTPTAVEVPRALALAEPGSQYFIYLPAGGEVALDLSHAAGRFAVHRVDAKTGCPIAADESIAGGKRATLSAPSGPPAIFWLAR